MPARARGHQRTGVAGWQTLLLRIQGQHDPTLPDLIGCFEVAHGVLSLEPTCVCESGLTRQRHSSSVPQSTVMVRRPFPTMPSQLCSSLLAVHAVFQRIMSRIAGRPEHQQLRRGNEGRCELTTRVTIAAFEVGHRPILSVHGKVASPRRHGTRDPDDWRARLLGRGTALRTQMCGGRGVIDCIAAHSSIRDSTRTQQQTIRVDSGRRHLGEKRQKRHGRTRVAAMHTTRRRTSQIRHPGCCERCGRRLTPGGREVALLKLYSTR